MASIVVSPYIPFAPLAWWASLLDADALLLDGTEPFRKSTPRNRYRIAGANGLLQLSIPVAGGRSQHGPVAGVLIDNATRWQDIHWRGLFSAYGSAPFFAHYAPALEAFFLKPYSHLAAFGLDAVLWLRKVLQLDFEMQYAAEYRPAYEAATDWRHFTERLSGAFATEPSYAQVFGDRHSFLPNLSILDLLMNEGPRGSVAYLSNLSGRMPA